LTSAASAGLSVISDLGLDPVRVVHIHALRSLSQCAVQMGYETRKSILRDYLEYTAYIVSGLFPSQVGGVFRRLALRRRSAEGEQEKIHMLYGCLLWRDRGTPNS
jgi:hypothetical protein